MSTISDLFKKVRLETDDYTPLGLPRGSIGYIVDIYDGVPYIEFMNSDGSTIELLFLKPMEFSGAEDNPNDKQPRAEMTS